MRVSLAFLSLVLASGALVASENQDDFSWIQFQGGITDHRTKNPDHQQPAIGFGVGTWLNGNWGLEASAVGTYVNYGSGMRSKEVHATGSVLFNPFHTPQTFRPFLRLGLGTTTIGAPMSGTGSHTTRLSGVVGVGVQALLGNQMFASLEGRIVQIESNVSRKEGQALLGIGVRWGNHPPVAVAPPPPPPPPPPVEPPPPPAPVIVVQPAPAPAPVVIVVPAPEPVDFTRRVTFSADNLFGFNKSTLRPTSKTELDTFAAELKGTKFRMIRVTGHTDRIGTQAYNQKLSLLRAEAVKDYLVEALGIPADKISARGVAGSEPVTKPGECKGNKKTKKLIACLQPDRRVEVEVTGRK